MKNLKNLLSTLLVVFLISQINAQFSMKYCKSALNNVVTTYDLYEGYSQIGYVIQMNRSSSHIKANYIPNAEKSSRDLVTSLIKDAGNKYVFLASVGAYSDNYSGVGVPIGLCVHNGRVINSEVDTDMDGLVIVEAVGGVRVSNIDEGNLNVRMESGNYKTINLNKNSDRNKFLNWAKRNDATVFQTHLLIYRNQNKVGTNGSSDRAIRKVLALVKDSRGTLYHSIIYINNKNLTLYELSSSILDMYNKQNYNVIACLNLDTGACNYLETVDPVTSCSGREIIGTSDISKATNLIYYEYVP